MHEFDIQKGVNESAILFCRKCALSFALVKFREPGDQEFQSSWQPISYRDHNGKKVNPNWKPCEKQ